MKTARTETPVCPHCEAEMTPFVVVGYYETVSGWGCLCDEKFIEELARKKKNVHRGAYG
jgi:transposase-like protein